MFLKDRVTGYGMLVITWVLLVLTLPIFYASSIQYKKQVQDLTKCGKMCYPYKVAEENKHICLCQPIIN